MLLLALPLLAAAPVAAQQKAGAAEGRKAIGKFDDWTAATNGEGGQTVCYAFVRASGSAPAVPGRGEPMLMVTHRPGSRDAVSISAGFAYAQNATVAVQVEGVSNFEFYTAGRNAYAREGRATASALVRGRQVVARSPAPRNVTVADTFSLRGFGRAYEAIGKACPPK